MEIRSTGITSGYDKEQEHNKKTGVTVKITNTTKKDFKKQMKKISKDSVFSEILDEVSDLISKELDSVQKKSSRIIYNEMAEILKEKTPYDDTPTRELEREVSDRPQEHLRDKIQRRISQTSTYVTTIFAGWEKEYFKKIADYNQYGTGEHTMDGPLSYPYDRYGDSNWRYLNGGTIHPGSTINTGFIDEAKIDIAARVSRIIDNNMNTL